MISRGLVLCALLAGCDSYTREILSRDLEDRDPDLSACFPPDLVVPQPMKPQPVEPPPYEPPSPPPECACPTPSPYPSPVPVHEPRVWGVVSASGVLLAGEGARVFDVGAGYFNVVFENDHPAARGALVSAAAAEPPKSSTACSAWVTITQPKALQLRVWEPGSCGFSFLLLESTGGQSH